MPKKVASTKRPKLTRAQKKAARVERRQQRRENWSNFRQAFTMTVKQDKRFLPYAITAAVVTAGVIFTLATVFGGSLVISIPTAVLGALVASLLVFNRRAQRMTFDQADGTPGAAAWVLQNQLRGDWHTEQAIAATNQLDAVHRLIGRPGIVLVGEGAPHRVRGLLAQEKRKIARIAGDTPIYDIVIGNGEGEVPLRKLNSHLFRLPKNLAKADVTGLERRLQALDTRRIPLPQGPMPAGAKVRNVQRAARRRS
jgi:hypothetical protein